jgi:RHS repeat-associated protein
MTDSSGTTAYSYDDAERLTSVTPPTPQPVVNYTWDNNGDLTARGSDSFAWDYEDRMTSVTVNSVTTTFTYRGDGLRNSRTTGGVTTGFTWDVNRGLPVVLDDGNQYVYGAGLESMVTDTGTYYYLPDGLGSTMAVVDTSGTVQKSYTYEVYGKPTATGSLANEFDFAGQQTDPTGLQYLRARYMDPATGTFNSRDPLAAAPSWSGNTFSYANASSVRFTDPTGLVLDNGGDGCGKGSCQDINDLVPHREGTFFAEYGGHTLFCEPRYNVWLHTVDPNCQPADFNLRATCEISWGYVLCKNQFGGVIAAGRIREGDRSLVEDLALSCAVGVVTGAVGGALGGAAVAGPGGAVAGAVGGIAMGAFEGCTGATIENVLQRILVN